MRTVISHIWAISGLCLMFGCTDGTPPESRPANEVASKLSHEFGCIRMTMEKLVVEAENFLSSPEKFTTPLYPDRKYHFYQGTMFYAIGEEGEGAIMATGHTPVDETFAQRIKSYEHLEGHLKNVKDKCGWISMAWLGTEESIGVFYPPYDIVALTPLRLNVAREIIPYIAASPQSNPDGKVVWTEPYVDITGKGYMVTASAPVSTEGKQHGVVGADLTLETIIAEILNRDGLLLLLSRSGYVVGATTAARKLTGVKALGNIDYLNMATEDVPAPELFKIHEQAKTNPVAKQIAEAGMDTPTNISFEIQGATYTATVLGVSESGWKVVELSPAK